MIFLEQGDIFQASDTEIERIINADNHWAINITHEQFIRL
jgi:hypothetical protein